MIGDRRSWQLDPVAECVGIARDLALKTLIEWGLEGLAERATLIVSELVTNAVVHAATPIALALRLDEKGLHGEVADRSPTLPAARHLDDMAEGGRGLSIVDLTADAWGVDSTGQGKTVWFECREAG